MSCQAMEGGCDRARTPEDTPQAVSVFACSAAWVGPLLIVSGLVNRVRQLDGWGNLLPFLMPRTASKDKHQNRALAYLLALCCIARK